MHQVVRIHGCRQGGGATKGGAAKGVPVLAAARSAVRRRCRCRECAAGGCGNRCRLIRVGLGCLASVNDAKPRHLIGVLLLLGEGAVDVLEQLVEQRYVAA